MAVDFKGVFLMKQKLMHKKSATSSALHTFSAYTFIWQTTLFLKQHKKLLCKPVITRVTSDCLLLELIKKHKLIKSMESDPIDFV